MALGTWTGSGESGGSGVGGFVGSIGVGGGGGAGAGSWLLGRGCRGGAGANELLVCLMKFCTLGGKALRFCTPKTAKMTTALHSKSTVKRQAIKRAQQLGLPKSR